MKLKAWKAAGLALTADLPKQRAGSFDGQADGSALFYRVSPEYFETMGILLAAGRAFTDEDRPGAPWVIMISETPSSACMSLISERIWASIVTWSLRRRRVLAESIVMVAR